MECLKIKTGVFRAIRMAFCAYDHLHILTYWEDHKGFIGKGLISNAYQMYTSYSGTQKLFYLF